jgi:hypothetical protein
MIVNVGRVVPADQNVRKQETQKVAARIGKLVENEAAARKFGKNGEQARARRRLQHEILGRHRRGRRRNMTKADRGRELLEGLALLRPAGVRREQRRDFREHGKARCGTPLAHGGAKLAQEQNLRRLASLVGGFPGPGALGIRTTEPGDHCGAKRRGIDSAAAFEVGEQEVGRRNERGGGSGPHD